MSEAGNADTTNYDAQDVQQAVADSVSHAPEDGDEAKLLEQAHAMEASNDPDETRQELPQQHDRWVEKQNEAEPEKSEATSESEPEKEPEQQETQEPESDPVDALIQQHKELLSTLAGGQEQEPAASATSASQEQNSTEGQAEKFELPELPKLDADEFDPALVEAFDKQNELIKKLHERDQQRDQWFQEQERQAAERAAKEETEWFDGFMDKFDEELVGRSADLSDDHFAKRQEVYRVGEALAERLQKEGKEYDPDKIAEQAYNLVFFEQLLSKAKEGRIAKVKQSAAQVRPKPQRKAPQPATAFDPDKDVDHPDNIAAARALGEAVGWTPD